MHAAITKQQVGELGEHRGQVDTDSGRVYLKFCGALDIADGLYHGQLWFEEPVPSREYERFSVSAILGGQSKTLFDDQTEVNDG